MRETKIHIPFHPSTTTSSSSNDINKAINIVGILAQVTLPAHTKTYPLDPIIDSTTTRHRPIAILLHGVLAHKDQLYHKQLVSQLCIDSFRFDFRGNAESKGEWSMSSFDQDLEDLDIVIDYLRNQLGYKIQVLIGHSRGAIDGFAYFQKFNHDLSLRIPYFVAISARFKMEKIHDRDAIYQPAFEKEGFYRWNVKVAGEKRQVLVYPNQVTQFAQWPTKQIVDGFPKQTDVLLLHGTADKTVPVSDVSHYTNLLTSRLEPGSLTLCLIDHADHNFIGFFDPLVKAITDWLRHRFHLASLGLNDAGGLRTQQRRQVDSQNNDEIDVKSRI